MVLLPTKQFQVCHCLCKGIPVASLYYKGCEAFSQAHKLLAKLRESPENEKKFSL